MTARDRQALEAPSPSTTGRVDRAGRRVILLASLGGALEYYDFIVFGVFAKDIAAAIFPSDSALLSLMVSFGAFAVGYLARPIGGIVLSHFGDRYGRRRVFLYSILVVSGATLAMGLVPSYAAWGAAASVLMVVLRLVQGFCLGGELPGAVTYVVETMPRRAGFACGLVYFCVMLGVVLATVLSLAVHSFLTPEQAASYGWRIGFLFGGVIGLLGFLVRRSLQESREFERMRHAAARHPFRELLRMYPGRIAVGIAALTATGCFNGLLFAHMPAYLTGVLHYDPGRAMIAQNIALGVHTIALLAVGWLADKLPRPILLRTGAFLLMVLAYPAYRALVDQSVDPLLVLGLAAVVAALVNGTFAPITADLFPTRVRYSGIALVTNVSFTGFSGTAPLVATSLVAVAGAAAPAYLMAACALVTFVASFIVSGYGGYILSGAGGALGIDRPPEAVSRSRAG